MNILWLKQIQWQFCKYKKTYSELSRDGLRFQNKKAHSTHTLWTAGSNSKNRDDSLTKSTPKGYLLISVVGMTSDGGGRSRALGGGRRRSPAVGRHGRRHELAGVHRKTRYGPLFAKPIAWGDRGGQRELTKRILETQGRLGGNWWLATADRGSCRTSASM